MAFYKTIALASLLLFATGCIGQRTEAVPPSQAVSITTTASPTIVFAPDDTPLPTPPQPTATPVSGTTTTQVNVRSEPSTSGSVLGMLPPNSQVQVTAKDPGGNWWQILYESGVDGKGWVTSQYVNVSNPDSVPVIGGNTTDPNSGNVAIVQQQINVRSGPGTGFNSLGTLNAQDVVNLTGKDANGAWLQIAYAAGPDGKGWINAAFVQAHGVENLPIITEAGQVIGTGTPTGIPATPTATLLPAAPDNDSQTSPIVSVTLDANGTRSFIYNGDVSSPGGDAEDWVGFSTSGKTVYASISCTTASALQIELLQNGMPMQVELNCNTIREMIRVDGNTGYLIHIRAAQTDTLQYTQYTIKIETSP